MASQARYNFRLSSEETEDLESEIWVKAFGIRQDRRSWLGYVMTVMQNAKQDYLKQRAKQGGRGLTEVRDYRTTDYESATSKFQLKDKYKNPVPPLEILLPPTMPEYERDVFIQSCFAKLTSRECGLLHDYFWRQLTYKEIGDERGVSLQTAINWVRHAQRRFLRAAEGKHLNNVSK